MRAESTTQDWLKVCQVLLNWDEVLCDGSTNVLASEMVEVGCDVEEEDTVKRQPFQRLGHLLGLRYDSLAIITAMIIILTDNYRPHLVHCPSD